jgi:hypothetical protein
MTRVLIASHSSDKHAFVVAEALRLKGVEAVVWCTSDFPSLATETLEFRGGRTRIAIRGPGLDLDGSGFSAVWHRRPTSLPALHTLHPADRVFAKQQCDAFRRSLYLLMARDAFWVNPPLASLLASQKALQHDLAAKCGLLVPATLVSNSPDDIRAFIADQGGAAVFKPLAGAPWQDDDTHWMPYTTLLRVEDLVDDDLLRQTPSIFQALVPKAHELRVTIMGRQAFTAKILSQQTEHGRLDWRRSYDELRMERAELPDAILDGCLALMAELSIVFGCFDFIVTPDGQHIFLEVNEMGQFIFVEHYVDMPLLDAFCDFLAGGDPAYRWRPGTSTIRTVDIDEAATRAMAAMAEIHPEPPMPSFYEGTRDMPNA